MPIHSLSRDLVSAISTQYPGLEALNLSQNRILHIENLEPLTSLTKLDLSSNLVTAARNLEHVTRLQELYLQDNKISLVEPSLLRLKDLRILDLRANELSDLESLVHVLSQLPNLRQLSLCGNPCAQEPNYVWWLAGSCRSLTVLDGVPLEALLRATAASDNPNQLPRQPLAQLKRDHPAADQCTASNRAVKQPADTQCTGALVSSAPDLAAGAQHDCKSRRLLPTASDRASLQPVAPTYAPDARSASQEAATHSDQAELAFSNHKQLRGELQALKEELDQARAASQQDRSLVQQTESDRDAALRQLAASKETVAQLRSYIGLSASKSVSGDGSAGTAAPATDCIVIKETPEKRIRTAPGLEPSVALMEQHIQALQEIIDTQEAQMVEHGPEAGAELLTRWRQEVFKGIIARRTAELEAKETARVADGKVSLAAELTRHAERAAQIAQQKAVAQQLELERKSSNMAELKAELGNRQKELSVAQSEAAELHAVLLAMARAAESTQLAAVALEKKLMDGQTNLAALTGRLHFAERRMKVLDTLLRRGGKQAIGKSLGTQFDGSDAAAAAQNARSQLLQVSVVSTTSLEREMAAMQSEREVLLHRIQAMEEDTVIACRDAAAQARQQAAAELQSALEAQQAEFEEAVAAREAQESEKLQEAMKRAEDLVASLSAEKEAAVEQSHEMKRELRALQGDLAALHHRVHVLGSELTSAQQERQAEAVQQERETSELTQQLKDSEACHREELAALRAEYEDNHRQGAKAVVTVRQLERQIARLQAKQQTCVCEEFHTLEQKLRERDAALRAVRRERNALLAAQREGGASQGAVTLRTPAEESHTTLFTPRQPPAAPVAPADDSLTSSINFMGTESSSAGSRGVSHPLAGQTRDTIAHSSRQAEQPAMIDRLTELESLAESLLDDL